LSNLNIEVCGTPIADGYAPLPFEDTDQFLHPARGYLSRANDFSNIGMESFNQTGMLIIGMYLSSIKNILMAQMGQIGQAQHGLYIHEAKNCSFSDLEVTGGPAPSGYSVAGVYLDQSISGCKFKGIKSPSWRLPTNNGAPGNDSYHVELCPDFDGGNLFANRPQAPTSFGQEFVFTDSVDPVWDSVALKSNVGKPITGGGTNKVRGRWNGTQWVLAG
jgi:hypothetical protein